MVDKLEVLDQQYQVVAKATISVQLVVDVTAGNLDQAAYRGMEVLSDMILDDIDFKDIQYLGFRPADTFVELIIDGQAVDSKWVLGSTWADNYDWVTDM